MKDHQKELSQDYQPVLGNTVLLGYYYKYIRTGFISKYFLYYVKDWIFWKMNKKTVYTYRTIQKMWVVTFIRPVRKIGT